MNPIAPREKALDLLQRISLSLMAVLILLTFVAANLQAVLWQSSQWLVSTVLPAVVVELTNDERSDNNVGPLRRNATLDAAAKLKAEHMAKNQYFAHFAPDGTSPWYWFKEAGYTYAHAGENLAIHFTDSTEVVEAWMDSPTHRENIVNGLYTEIGVGTAKGKFDGYNTVYVVQLFGTPAVKPAPAPAPAPTPVPAPVAPRVPAVPVPAPTPTPAPVALPQSEAVLAAETPTAVVEAEEVASTSPETDTSTQASTTASTTASATPVIPPAAILETNRPVITDEIVFLESSMIATSSGLAVASITESTETVASQGFFGLATKPGKVLQIVYSTLGVIVVLLLLASIILEVRRKHLTQVIYGSGLLLVMVCLWVFHSYITSGAVIM
jgi:uncharacterized protein YkwD